MANPDQPPTPRYELTVTITGNTLSEIEHELLITTRGFVIDSGYYQCHEWHVTGGTSTRVMRQKNPDMTPERYKTELFAWHKTASSAWREARTAKRPPEGA